MTLLINVLLSFLNPSNYLQNSIYDLDMFPVRSVRIIQNHRYRCIMQRRGGFRSLQTLSMSNPIGGIGLDSLKSTTEDGLYLRQSIQHWLDIEYIPQIIHFKIGIEVEKIYLQRRSMGVVDLGEMLMDVGTGLERFDMEDAFVNAWDVANKVSDLLMVRMNQEVAPCAGDMSAFIKISESIGNVASQTPIMPVTVREKKEEKEKGINLDKKDFVKLTRTFSSKFARYCFMREFLEGESSWNTMEIVLAVLFGCRLSPSTAEIGNEGFKWSTELCAYGWEDIALTLFPTASFLTTPHDHSTAEEEVKKNLALELRIVEDIPEDEGSTDVVCESLIGLEPYVEMKVDAGLCSNRDGDGGSSVPTESDGDGVKIGGDVVLRRRILLTKWLYVHGFLDEDFPPTTKFIPVNRRDQI